MKSAILPHLPQRVAMNVLLHLQVLRALQVRHPSLTPAQLLLTLHRHRQRLLPIHVEISVVIPQHLGQPHLITQAAVITAAELGKTHFPTPKTLLFLRFYQIERHLMKLF